MTKRKKDGGIDDGGRKILRKSPDTAVAPKGTVADEVST
jgi:hypothetical protein